MTLLTLTLFHAKPVVADDSAAARQRFGEFWTYFRHQAPTLLPNMPGGTTVASMIRDPERFARDRLEDTGTALGLIGNDEEETGGDGKQTAFLHPLAALIAQPVPEAEEAFWVNPAYHHKGLLPVDDTLVLGFGARSAFLNRRVSLDLQPYYAQNWMSTQGYWGAQLAVGINPDHAPKPWGKISIGFTDGASNLMDHTHGFTLHSEWNFGEHITMNAGVRSSDAQRADNFVMMRWVLAGD